MIDYKKLLLNSRIVGCANVNHFFHQYGKEFSKSMVKSTSSSSVSSFSETMVSTLSGCLVISFSHCRVRQSLYVRHPRNGESCLR